MRATSSQSPTAALARLARHGAHVQIAAFTAAGKGIVGWAQAVDRYAEAVGDEVLRRIDGGSASPDLIARLVDATSVHLRELTTLPRAATAHFETRLERVSVDNQEVR